MAEVKQTNVGTSVGEYVCKCSHTCVCMKITWQTSLKTKLLLPETLPRSALWGCGKVNLTSPKSLLPWLQHVPRKLPMSSEIQHVHRHLVFPDRVYPFSFLRDRGSHTAQLTPNSLHQEHEFLFLLPPNIGTVVLLLLSSESYIYTMVTRREYSAVTFYNYNSNYVLKGGKTRIKNYGYVKKNGAGGKAQRCSHLGRVWLVS